MSPKSQERAWKGSWVRSSPAFCANYVYTGLLESVNATCIKLAEASIVYETTGPFMEPKWKDAQRLPNAVYIQCAAIESFTTTLGKG